MSTLESVMELLSRHTFSVEHNPNCPSPYLVRLVGFQRGGLDKFEPNATNDYMGYGKTLVEAADAAFSAKTAFDTFVANSRCPVCTEKPKRLWFEGRVRKVCKKCQAAQPDLTVAHHNFSCKSCGNWYLYHDSTLYWYGLYHDGVVSKGADRRPPGMKSVAELTSPLRHFLP